MSDREWMPVYWASYMKKTSRLSAAEHGAYLMLIADYWISGTPLPNSDEQLRRISRMTEKEWKASKATIMSFFKLSDGVWRHDRVDEEIARATLIIEKSKAKTAAATAARWAKNDP